MRDNEVALNAVSVEKAKRLTDANKHGYVWHPGLYVIIDDQTSIIETREEADVLIAELIAAADELWPRS